MPEVDPTIGAARETLDLFARVRSRHLAHTGPEPDWHRWADNLALALADVLPAASETGRLDSEAWVCRRCGGQFIGRRPADDICRGCDGQS
jgi:hypothetical protein